MSSTPARSVHDNHLASYEVHCERREIRLHTEFRYSGEPFEFTDMCFSGVVAYDFSYDSEALGGTIILDVDEVPTTGIYADHAEEFKAGLPYGWPGWWAETPEAAAAFFETNGVRGFQLWSACGMVGWVLARAMTIEPAPAKGPSPTP